MELSPGLSFKLIIASMLGLSTFFTIDVEMRRQAWRGDTTELQLEDGAAIVVDRALDGDELSVHLGDRTFTVRLLGVKAFDVSNEPGLGDPGQRAIDTLSRYAGAEGVLHFETMTLDRADRLLARIEIDGADVGESLIGDGWAITYTKYPFDAMNDYLAREAVARQQRRGLWSSPKASERALKLRASWDAP